MTTAAQRQEAQNKIDEKIKEAVVVLGEAQKLANDAGIYLAGDLDEYSIRKYVTEGIDNYDSSSC